MFVRTTRWLLAGGFILATELLGGTSALIAPGPASAAPGDIFLKIRHDLIHITGRTCDGSVRVGDGSVRACDGSVLVGRQVIETDSGEFDVNVVWDNDPFISFSVSAINPTASPVTYDFMFTTPYSGGPYDTMIANLSGSVIERVGGAASSTSATVSLEGVLDGSVIGALTIGGTCATSGLGFNDVFDCGAYGPSVAPVGSAATGDFTAHFAFTLSPRDGLSFTGMVELTTAPSEVPAPASALLLAGALGGLALRRRA